MRRAARTDGNHKEVVDEFRRLGCSVLDMSRLGEGAPDLLIGYGGISILVEVKDGRKPPSKATLSTLQVQWWLDWKQNPRVVRNLEQVAETVKVLTQWHGYITKGIKDAN